jgi:Kef-type K+ transport system membrane component KefB
VLGFGNFQKKVFFLIPRATMIRRSRSALIYAASFGVSIGTFFLIRSLGPSFLAAGPQVPVRPPTSETPGILLHVLLALVVVLVIARILGAMFRRVNQPQVMGEVVAGILLGPSFLGWLAPRVAFQVLPVNTAPYLAVIAQVGVVLYMFLVGLDLDTDLLQKRTQAAIAISHASIVVPFLLGAAFALWLYPLYSTGVFSFTTFALFIGVAMSITAFPVLARILTDRGMQKTRLGVLALACAAIDDVTAWCLLAFAIGVAHAQTGSLLFILITTIGFIVFVLLIAKRGALWLVGRQTAKGRTTQDMFAIVCAALLLSALATERIGVHALFGAFLLGTIIPHDSVLARDIRARCEDLVVVLLLPVFFAFTGMRTQIGLLHGIGDWMACILIIGVALLGKFGGSFLAARWTGSDWREAASLGVLMNTRGLMELIVLNVGLDLGVLSPVLFTMFVIMAVATTLVTTPILHRLRESRPQSPAPIVSSTKVF